MSGLNKTQSEDSKSQENGKSQLAQSSMPTSNTAEKSSSGSTKRWRRPTNVREFSAQANDVATRVLNGEITMDEARTYAAVARIVGQSFGIEMARARESKTVPMLDIEEFE